MNYAAHYDRIIARARDRTLTGYRERHHVLPRCMGGSDDPANIVELTAEEHYVAHQLLVKMYPSVRGLATAVVRMAKQCTGNKAYAWLRKRHAHSVSILMIGNKYGNLVSAESRRKSSERQRGKPLSEKCYLMGAEKRRGKPLSAEVRAKIGAFHSGKTYSAETRAKISASKLGRKLGPMSDETKAKLSAASIGKKRWLGKKHTAETREKMALARRLYWSLHPGKKKPPRSPEHRAKLAVAKRAYWQRLKTMSTPIANAQNGA